MTSPVRITKDLRKILRLCITNGVKTFQHGDLRLEFHENMPQTISTGRVRVSANMPKPNHEQQAEESLRNDEINVKEDQLAMLLIENPEEFERQIAAGDLEEAEEPDSDEDE